MRALSCGNSRAILLSKQYTLHPILIDFMAFHLFASDIDGTLIPYEDSHEQQVGRREFFSVLAAFSDLMLCYATGRSLKLALAAIDQFGLPLPAVLICDVGASIYWREHGRWVLDQNYSSKLKAIWKGKTAQDLIAALSDLDYLTLQEEEHLSDFKVSYYLPLNIKQQQLNQQLAERLSGSGFLSSIIHSVDPVRNCGLIDLLPHGVDKNFALHFLAQKKRFRPADIVYAGDSGNDLAAFLGGFNAIVVANTPEEVKASVRKQQQSGGLGEIFFAQHDSILGVNEGLRFFGARDARTA